MKKAILMLGVILGSMSVFASSSFTYDTRGTGTASVPVIKEVYDPNGYVLQACKNYQITIKGNYSIWSHSQWPGTCATADNAPLYPSPGVTNGKVGFDPEFTYAHIYSGGCTMTPTTNNRIQINLDGTGTPNWQHARNLDINSVIHSFDGTTHSYTYIVTGNGHALGIRQNAGENFDDYGVLHVEIEPVTTPCEEIELEMDLSFDPNWGCNVLADAYITNCDPDIQILSSTIDFGDGTVTSGPMAGHVYTTPGAYAITATFWVTNGEECCRITVDDEVDVDACDPCEMLQSITISANTSNDPTIVFNETGIVSHPTVGFVHVWNFGDGTTVVGGNSVSHTYASSGTYTVTLTVFYLDEENGICCHEEATIQVNVTNASSKSAGSGSSQGSIYSTMDATPRTVNVFPNPTSGTVDLKLYEDTFTEVLIYDVAGTLVKSISNVTDAATMQVDLSGNSKGMYLLKMNTTSGKSYSERVMLR